MKKIGFAPALQPLVLSGQKTLTWRLFDDKNLTEGEEVEFVDQFSRVFFANAKLVKVWERPMGKLLPEDKDGHEKFSSDEEMYKTYSGYYQREVGPETIVKIIRFKLL